MNMNGNGPGGKKSLVLVKPENMWRTVKRLFRYMKKSSLLIALTLVAAVAGTLMQVATPKMLGNATTLIFDGAMAGGRLDFNGLVKILAIVSALYAGVFAASFLQERIMTVVSLKTTYTLRNALKEKMNRVPVSYFDKNSNGSLMSVAINDVDNIVNNLQQSLTQLISSVILVVGILAVMLSISPRLTLIALIMVPGTALVMKLFTGRTQTNSKTYYGQMGSLNGRIEETYQGFEVVKGFGSKDDALKKFDEINEKMYESGWKMRFFGGSMMPSMLLVQNAIYVLIAVVGATRVVRGSIRIGDMQAFLQYSTQFTSPLAKFSQIWGNVLSIVVSAERVFEILDAEEMEPGAALLKAEREIPLHAASKIAFDHVQFGYTDELLMKDFSLRVEEGQMVAIVGHTGAGKSTLINLLQRFYEVRSGSIRIDGKDIRCMDYSQVRGQIGMVLQESWLFSGSIYENIRFGNEDATDEQIYAAAKAAYADEFIQKLPNGYDTVLGEDAANISQGQRQLLTIARAFAADPDILVLDEATSNVDSRTELIVQKAMRRLLAGRTSFVVAHRLSTVYDADKIIVMENGDIVETGSHIELINRGGTYADIYNSQFSQKIA